MRVRRLVCWRVHVHTYVRTSCVYVVGRSVCWFVGVRGGRRSSTCGISQKKKKEKMVGFSGSARFVVV